MGEWLIAETSLFGVTVQNWLLVACGLFAAYGIGLRLGLWRLGPRGPHS